MGCCLTLAALALAGCATTTHPDLGRLYRVGTQFADTTPVIVIPGVFGSKLRDRTTGVSDDLVRRLAGEAGIDREWWEVDGTHHVVAPESLRAVLAAMHLPAATQPEAEASLAGLQAERQRMLPHTLVMRANEAGVLPGRASRRRVLHISSDDGEERRIEFKPGSAELALPALPPGYYDCRFDDAPDTGCRRGPGI